jgi:ABC-type Fe3+ transport system substrate-binding protein
MPKSRRPVVPTRSRAFFLAGLLGLSFLIPGSRAVGERAIVLTPHVDAIRIEFANGFAKWHQEHFQEPGGVEWRNVGGTSDALRFIRSEFRLKPDGIGLDILFGGGQEPYLVLADEALSAPYRAGPEYLDGIPPAHLGMEIYDPEFHWYAAAISSFGILQNTRLQRIHGFPLVRRWADLGHPQLMGWVGAGDPRNSGTMYVMFEAFLQAYGWQKGWNLLTQIAGNVRKFDRVSSTTAKDVTLGETAYAFAIDFYAFSQIAVAGRTNMTFVLPEDFTAINVDCIAILKGAPHRRMAERFVDFVLSEAGQRLWFLPRGHPQGPQQFSIERMSVRPAFYPRYRGVSNIEFSPFELTRGFNYDAKLSRTRREVVAALAGAVLVDTHTELTEAWRHLNRRSISEAELEALGSMPLTEAEALSLSTGQWKSAEFRNQKRLDWQNWARAKYRKLCKSSSKI